MLVDEGGRQCGRISISLIQRVSSGRRERVSGKKIECDGGAASKGG